MSKYADSKGVQTYQKRRKDGSRGPLPSHTPIPPVDGLQSALKDNRVPTTSELLEEAKCLLAQIMIGLRTQGDIYKSATAIQKLVSSIASITAVEKVDEVSTDAIKKMTDEELKDYAKELINKLN